MEIIDENNNKSESKNQGTEMYNTWESKHDNGRLIGGLIIVGIGCIFLARQMGAYIPHWLFSWPLLLIAIGIYSGVKHSFQNTGWIIMVLIGGAFLLRDFIPGYDISNYVWPAIIIIIGLFIMVKPRSNPNKWSSRYQSRQQPSAQWEQAAPGDEYLDTSAVFGSVKKHIISKNFKGGEVNCVFGGGEINMSQADITGVVELELNAVFGGMRLVVPSHWEIKSELTAVLGSVEDKRMVTKNVGIGSGKLLVLKGTAVFGGIEILSY